MNDKTSCALSLILCSRNDEYMGNSRWRLQTSLNYAADQIEALGRAEDVEILVVDWGSGVPLSEVIELTPAALRVVSFILVPPELARPLQKDSPFPEVLALNAAARRAKGAYVGRIDQDTLVGRRFLEAFLEFVEGKPTIQAPREQVMFFANVRMVPYRFAVRCPPLWMVERYIERMGHKLPLEIGKYAPFYCSSVGIWLLPQVIWHECGGYDESMLYMNSMEIDMIQRLLTKYAIVDLGRMVDFDFYHLEHYHPWVPRKSAVFRKTNKFDHNALPGTFNPNGRDWGLGQYPLGASSPPMSGAATATSRRKWRARDEAAFSTLLLLARIQALVDVTIGQTVKFLGQWFATWRYRLNLARDTVWGRPIGSWYRLLRQLWIAKRAARQRGAR